MNRMKISVKFFASLREQLNQAEANLDLNQPTSVLAIWQQASGLETLPENTLCAVDMEYVDATTVVEQDAEVAFFPPVTGG